MKQEFYLKKKIERMNDFIFAAPVFYDFIFAQHLASLWFLVAAAQVRCRLCVCEYAFQGRFCQVKERELGGLHALAMLL